MAALRVAMALINMALVPPALLALMRVALLARRSQIGRRRIESARQQIDGSPQASSGES